VKEQLPGLGQLLEDGSRCVGGGGELREDHLHRCGQVSDRYKLVSESVSQARDPNGLLDLWQRQHVTLDIATELRRGVVLDPQLKQGRSETAASRRCEVEKRDRRVIFRADELRVIGDRVEERVQIRGRKEDREVLKI
jgi:hypothetical protein